MQDVLKSAEASLVRILNEWLRLLRKNDALAQSWLEEARVRAQTYFAAAPHHPVAAAGVLQR